MAVTLGQLTDIFKEANAAVFTDNEKMLLYPFVHQNQQMLVYITLAEDGEYVRFIIPCYLNLNAARNREALLMKLMEQNRTLKLLKFGVDPEDGEITVSIELPVEDSPLTAGQVHRCMYTLTHVAMNERERLLSLIQTGIYPDSRNEEFQTIVSNLLSGNEETEEEHDSEMEEIDLLDDADEDAASED
ncbi:MAG TPA: YbjN domain-containing protein [Chthonomonas sp.]|uniref:YbjN domain-containing protein n=1 Tax=Chthonomonas sp. TaxID=2282153 RepID=UPI002B4B1B8E|nr:YbjN domain-containing protein [Chthonomonas sp.]HLH80652.1 YbjN domain-containing protein [Chthonomonas sp.]